MFTFSAWRGYALISSVLCLLTQSPASYSLPVNGDLLITEIMANPSEVADNKGEWFEIYNTSSAAIDLVGLVVTDRGSNQFTVGGDSPRYINSGDYYVFGRHADQTANGGYVADYDYGSASFSLVNSRDAIILQFADLIIDQLDYNQTTAGASAELTADGFSTTPDSFVYGDGDNGTPGMAGSYRFQSVALAESVAVPEPAAFALLLPALALLLRHSPQT